MIDRCGICGEKLPCKGFRMRLIDLAIQATAFVLALLISLKHYGRKAR